MKSHLWGTPKGLSLNPSGLIASLVTVVAWASLGCVPEIDDRSFRISTTPTLLAISSTPAEAAPPASVTFRALYVDASGDATTDPGAELTWAFCTARQALTDPGTVSPECLELGGSALVDLGSGPSATGALPVESCRLFGPDQPDTVAGQPPGRPVDPDATGGFYQPVQLVTEDGSQATSFGATRIACGLASAPADIAATFTRTYRNNEAPALASLSIVRADGSTTEVPPDASGASVKAGEQVTLRAAWADCATATAACTGSEPYVAFDPETRELTTQREAIRVAWYATGGLLVDDTSGRAADEADQVSLDNAWTAPTTSGTTLLWLVIRDDRGGVGWQSYRVQVD